MRPYIICHMLSSVDGKIDGAALKGLTSAGEYEITGAQLNGDAWICGRTTMQQHFADPEPFVPSSPNPAGPQPVHVARRAQSYAIALSLLIAPGIDGRQEIPAVLDGMNLSGGKAVPLRLKSVERRESDTLWLRYEARR